VAETNRQTDTSRLSDFDAGRTQAPILKTCGTEDPHNRSLICFFWPHHDGKHSWHGPDISELDMPEATAATRKDTP